MEEFIVTLVWGLLLGILIGFVLGAVMTTTVYPNGIPQEPEDSYGMQIYKEGQEAARLGKPWTANPYVGNVAHRWKQGWEDGFNQRVAQGATRR